MEYNFHGINSHIIIIFKYLSIIRVNRGKYINLDFLKEHDMSFNQSTYCVYGIWLGALRGH